jgi:hypothetical protein
MALLPADSTLQVLILELECVGLCARSQMEDTRKTQGRRAQRTHRLVSDNRWRADGLFGGVGPPWEFIHDPEIARLLVVYASHVPHQFLLGIYPLKLKHLLHFLETWGACAELRL